jgi:hypothetical protein
MMAYRGEDRVEALCQVEADGRHVVAECHFHRIAVEQVSGGRTRFGGDIHHFLTRREIPKEMSEIGHR